MNMIRFFSRRAVRTIVVFGSLGIAMAACQTMAQKTNVLSDSKILSDSAGVLGYQAGDLTLLSRNTVGTNTYANIQAKDGKKFHCMINGGNLLSFGMTNPPTCSPAGQPLSDSPFTQGK
jgi:hypothetical protein